MNYFLRGDFMGKQIEVELKEINNKRKLKKDAAVTEKSFKFVNSNLELELKVKGEDNANTLGLPIEHLKDKILIEFGAKNRQTDLLQEQAKKKENKK